MSDVPFLRYKKIRGRSAVLSIYTSFFSAKELWCQCYYDDCTDSIITERCLKAIHSYRELKNCPVYVTSNYRCEKHNKDVGGGKYSNHLKGDAVDIALNDEGFIDNKRMLKIAGFKRALHYPKRKFVHVDFSERFVSRGDTEYIIYRL